MLKATRHLISVNLCVLHVSVVIFLPQRHLEKTEKHREVKLKATRHLISVNLCVLHISVVILLPQKDMEKCTQGVMIYEKLVAENLKKRLLNKIFKQKSVSPSAS